MPAVAKSALRRATATWPCLRSLVLSACLSLGIVTTAADAVELSAGCTAGRGQAPELLAVDGVLRHMIVVLPEDYEPIAAHALVVAFHGRTNNNAKARRYFGLEGSSRQPTIHVYPAGMVDDSGRFTWWRPGDEASRLRDFALFDALLQAMSREFCIDLEAVFVVGHSLGATFANSLGCMRADVIRGVASVAGGINPGSCAGEVAAMLLHNPEDQAVPIEEGRRALEILLGRSVADQERQRKLGEFACEQFRARPNPLLWCPHDQSVTRRGRYYPHQWPSGTGEAIATFFAELTE